MKRSSNYSVVVVIEGQDPFLPAQLAAINALQLGTLRIDVVVVHLGATEASSRALREAAVESRHPIRIIDGPAVDARPPRTFGLGAATGDWIVVLERNDRLRASTLRKIEGLIARHPELDAINLRHTGTGARVANLLLDPMALAHRRSMAFSRSALRSSGIRIDPGVGEELELRYLAARLAIARSSPYIGSIGRAVSRETGRRGDTIVAPAGYRARYVDVLRRGHLPLLQSAEDTFGTVPAWVQNIVIAELTTSVRNGGRANRATRVEPEDRPRLPSLLGDVVTRLEPQVVHEHPYQTPEPVWTEFLADAGRAACWRSATGEYDKTDTRSGLSRITYRYAGDRPKHVIVVDGKPVVPEHEKTMAHTYLGVPVLFEQIVWARLELPFELWLDGEDVPVVPAAPRPKPRREGVPILRRVVGRARRELIKFEGLFILPLAAWLPGARQYRGAWVLMDRINDADDNGQRLFEYLREHRPDINAWFVVRGGSDAWTRMEAAGHGPRLMEHGSYRWKLLMENAAWLISSHAKKSIVDPRALRGIVDHWRWRYAFLQHGVIKDDLSRWLNKLDIDLFVTSTPAELESILPDGSPYRYGPREMRQTGLPRWDRLRAKHLATAADDRDMVLVAPTWRKWLTLPLDPSSWRREVDAAFWESEYLREWTAVLSSEEIAAAAARRGWRIGFMPHPNMQPVLWQLDLPAHVEPISYAGNDIQSIFARCGLMVTDHSSVAFDLASIERPIVYYQFDTDKLFSGAHIGAAGYFDYVRDGFGPVATSRAEAIAAIVESIERGATPAPQYLERIQRTFPLQDGGACARVVEAIERFDDSRQPGWVPARAAREDGVAPAYPGVQGTA